MGLIHSKQERPFTLLIKVQKLERDENKPFVLVKYSLVFEVFMSVFI